MSKIDFVSVTVANETSQTTSQSIVGGTVNLQQFGNPYTITFDVSFNQDISLTGTVNGLFVEIS